MVSETTNKRQPRRQSAIKAGEKIASNTSPNKNVVKKQKLDKPKKNQKVTDNEKVEEKPEEKIEETAEKEEKDQEVQKDEESKVEETKDDETKDIQKEEAQADKAEEMIPDIEIINHENVTIKMRDMVQEKGAVIFVYPKAKTPGCTKQAVLFKENLETFKSKGYEVYGLSKDACKLNAAFKTANELSYDLLCDVDKKFSTWLQNSNTRSCVIFEKGGKLKAKLTSTKPQDSLDWALNIVQSE